MGKNLYHQTHFGTYKVGDSVELLKGKLGYNLKRQVQLILTSPPFPLNRKKKYGNLSGAAYKRWFIDLAPLFADLLKPDGSIVIEIGNSWLPRRPVQSLLHLESLLGFVKSKKAGLQLIQEFICHNPCRLPSPAEWVTIRRIRTTDSFTHVWWIANSDFPKADNRRVLRPYSTDMKKLLKTGKFNHGSRPSEHNISIKNFAKNNGGSIPHNVLEIESLGSDSITSVPNLVRFPNTNSNDFFMRECRNLGIKPHPARMPLGLASFFIEFLTEPGDLVVDPFAGSNTTGYVAELAGRKWLSIDKNSEYLEQSRIRLGDPIFEKCNKRRVSK